MKKLLLSFVAAFAVQLGISSAFAGDANDTTLINVDFNNITFTGDSVDYDPLKGDAQGGSTVELGLQHWGIWVKDETASFFGWQNYDLGKNDTLETWGTVYRKTESDNYLKIESDTEVWRRLGKDSSSNKASLHDFGAVTIKMKTQFSAAASDATGDLDPQDKISVWVKEVPVQSSTEGEGDTATASAETDTYENKLIVSAADDNGNAKDYVIDTNVDLTNLSTWYALEIKPVAGNKFEVYIGEGEGKVQLSSNGTKQFPSYSNTGLNVNGDQNSELDDKISVVGFKGTGSIDELEFIPNNEEKVLTLAWDDKLASLSYQYGDDVVTLTSEQIAEKSIEITTSVDGGNVNISYTFTNGYAYKEGTATDGCTFELAEGTTKAGTVTITKNATYTINSKEINFLVGDVPCETFEEALAELAADGGTIKLAKNVTIPYNEEPTWPGSLYIGADDDDVITLDLNGCTITGSYNPNQAGPEDDPQYLATIIVYRGTLNIVNTSATVGRVQGARDDVNGGYGYAVQQANTGKVNIYSGYYDGSVLFDPEGEDALLVSGGWFSGYIYEDQEFNPEDFDLPLADDYTVEQDGEYVKVVEAAPETFVAQIGEGEGAQKFETLQAAVDADAAEGQTIKLLENIALTKFVTIAKTLTLDLNDKSITRTDAIDNSTALFVNNENAVVTITGKGIVTADHAVYVNAGKVIIENGTFSAGSHAVYVINEGHAEIKGGTFSSNAGQYHYVLNEYDQTRNNTSIVVEGGTFVGFNPANNGAEGPNTDFCAEGLCGYVVKTVGGVDVYGVAAAVAQVGEAKFVSLEAAIAAAKAGAEEIKLLANIDAEASIRIAKKVTIDLNGYTIKSVNTNPDTADGVFYVAQGGELTIEATNGGIVDGGDVCGYEMAVWANGGKVIINGGTFQNGKFAETDTQYDLIYAKNGGEVVINDGTFKCSTPVWTLNNHNTAMGSITVYGGIFVGEAANPAESGDKKENFCALGFGSTYADGKWTVAKNAYIVTLPAAPANTSWKVVSGSTEISGKDGVYLVPMSGSSVTLVAEEDYEFADKSTVKVIVDAVSADMIVSAEGLPTVTEKQTDIWADVKDEDVDGVTAENKEAVNEALGAIATALGATSGSEATSVSAWIDKVYPSNGQISAATLISAGAKANLDVSIAYDLPLMEALPEVSVAAATATSGKAAFEFELKGVEIQAAAEKAKDLIKFAQNLKGANSAFGPVGENMTITIVGGKLKAEFSGKTSSGFATVDFTVPAAE